MPDADLERAPDRAGWADPSSDFRAAFLAGMQAGRKFVPCRFLYDEKGAAQFERICEQPEYYLTRAETQILERRAGAIAEEIGPGVVLFELGSGAGVKTRLLLDRLQEPAAYVPIDISADQLLQTARSLAADYPRLRIRPLAGDYTAPIRLPDIAGRRVAFFPGSTIGNLDHREAVALLAAWRMRLGPSGLFILGADLKKSPRILAAAYNDRAGVTEAFIRNIFERADRELGADFASAGFSYDARYIESEGRVEMRLVSQRRQSVRVADRNIAFEAGETVHIENSRKYDLAELPALASEAGFCLDRAYLDEAGWFAVCLLRAASS